MTDEELKSIVDRMANAEKVSLLTGSGLWHTSSNLRLNVPSILMTDGTYGVRYSVDQIEGESDELESIEQFMAVVNQKADRDIDGDFESTRPATCFPNGSAFACSWDVDLAYTLGAALAVECQAFGVNLLLGPGINIRRTPLAGRSYEYYSEDPVISGDIAAATINGLQDGGIGASLKHFACNNSEILRTSMSSDVDERALREIYLRGFERAIAKSNPWTIMSSYNRLNGVHAAENEWLLTTVLREEWGYEGLVISDWNGIKSSVAALNAGNDLDMPERTARRRQIANALEDGTIAREVADRACLRILKLVRKLKSSEQHSISVDFQAHHHLARQMAAESIVLLKNRNQLLPIKRDARIAIVGDAAKLPVMQGSGSATTKPTIVDNPYEEIRKHAASAMITFHPFDGTDPKLAAVQHRMALEAASETDVIIVFASTEQGYDGEGSDRKNLHLHRGQDALIADLAGVHPNVIVVVASPDAIEMPWESEVAAVLATFFAGQGVGEAVAQILFGHRNPSGKLTVTFPRRLQDTPAFLFYPGENGHHLYGEGIYVGYRYYDKREIEPLFPFGFGLSYTTFSYSNLLIDEASITDSSQCCVAFSVTNTGGMLGKEVCQLYVRPEGGRIQRPVRELKAFTKVELQPGETKRVEFDIDAKDLRCFDTSLGEWVLDKGALYFEIAASSRDIRLTQRVDCEPTYRSTFFTIDSQPGLLLADPIARRKLTAFFLDVLSLDQKTVDKLLAFCQSSFLGIYNSISWFSGDLIAEAALQAVLDDINAANEVSQSEQLAKPNVRGQPARA
ncbi:MAG: glycoside hydrolase family 3 C-terminal domain-containing protein [Rhodobacterales bacterium]|nr:glycoside hydrolase family 3 C-terminal domain-containing protein [Rhodobacterales bacterium]